VAAAVTAIEAPSIAAVWLVSPLMCAAHTATTATAIKVNAAQVTSRRVEA